MHPKSPLATEHVPLTGVQANDAVAEARQWISNWRSSSGGGGVNPLAAAAAATKEVAADDTSAEAQRAKEAAAEARQWIASWRNGGSKAKAASSSASQQKPVQKESQQEQRQQQQEEQQQSGNDSGFGGGFGGFLSGFKWPWQMETVQVTEAPREADPLDKATVAAARQVGNSACERLLVIVASLLHEKRLSHG